MRQVSKKWLAWLLQTTVELLIFGKRRIGSVGASEICMFSSCAYLFLFNSLFGAVVLNLFSTAPPISNYCSVFQPPPDFSWIDWMEHFPIRKLPRCRARKGVVPNRWVATPKWVAEEWPWVANSSLNSLLSLKFLELRISTCCVTSAKPKHRQIFVKFTLLQ